MHFFVLLCSIVHASVVVNEERPGFLSRNIKGATYPRLRRFLLHTLNDGALRDAFMVSRLSYGEPAWMQNLHNALKVAAAQALIPEDMLENVGGEMATNLDELLDKQFLFAEDPSLRIPFLEPFGPMVQVDSFSEDTLKRKLEELKSPVVHFQFSGPKWDKDVVRKVDVKGSVYELYMVNEDIIKGGNGVLYRFSSDDYAPILGNEMGEEVTRLVYTLHKMPTPAKENVQKREGGVNPIMVVAASFFFGLAISMFFLL